VFTPLKGKKVLLTDGAKATAGKANKNMFD
jgi:hypothetical protein